MATIASVDIGLGVNSVGLRRGLDESQARVRRFATRASRSYGTIATSVRSLGAAFAVITAGAGIRGLTRLTDEFVGVNNLLRASGTATEDLAAEFERVQNIATRTRANLGATASLFATIQRNSSNLGLTLNQVEAITATVQQSFALTGASVQEAAGATRQLSQALASGVLRGQELNSVLEQAPELARLIADSYGIGLGRLRELAAEGEITADRVVQAILNGQESINGRFQASQATFSQIGELFRTQLTEPIGAFVANILPGLQRAVSTLAAALPAIGSALGFLLPQLTAIGLALTTGVVARGIGAFIARSRVVTASLITTATAAATANAMIIRYGASLSFANRVAAVATLSIARLTGSLRVAAVVIGTTSAALGVLRRAISLLGGPIGIAVLAATELVIYFRDEVVAVLRSVANFFIRIANAVIRFANRINRYFGRGGDLIRPIEEFTSVVDTTAETVSNLGLEFDTTIPVIEDLAGAVEGATNSFTTFREGFETDFELFSSLAQDTFNSATDSILNFFETGSLNLRSFVADFIRGFARIRIQQALLGAFGGGTSNFLSGLSGAPARQFGGPVTAGQAYVVGERGPELFVPNSGGSVVSNSNLGGGGGNVTYNINATDARSFQQLVASDPSFIFNVTERGRRQVGV